MSYTPRGWQSCNVVCHQPVTGVNPFPIGFYGGMGPSYRIPHCSLLRYGHRPPSTYVVNMGYLK